MQTMVEKLRLIADGLEQGKKIEWRDKGSYQWHVKIRTHTNKMEIREEPEYRIRPDKPRVGNLYISDMPIAVELTPEVSKALEDAGIEI